MNTQPGEGQSLRKFKVGDEVIYQGLVAKVDVLTQTVYGVLTVGLIAKADPELTCTAREVDCELYDGQEYDENEYLLDVIAHQNRVMRTVDGLTDKNFRDGNH